MSIIVPAGKKSIEWSPKDEKLTKIASTEGDEEQSVSDPLLEAAMDALDKEAAHKCDECECSPCECKECDECKCSPCECKGKQTKEAMGCMDEDMAELEVEPSEEDEVEDVDTGSVADAVAEVEEKAEAAEAKIEQVLDAVEEISTAVESAKEACGEIADGDDGEVEGEIELEIEVEEVSDVEDFEEGGEDIVIESEPEMKEASSEEFCKFAKLSKGNRKKLADYWVNMLGYPRDYVSLMTKDYEK